MTSWLEAIGNGDWIGRGIRACLPVLIAGRSVKYVIRYPQFLKRGQEMTPTDQPNNP